MTVAQAEEEQVEEEQVEAVLAVVELAVAGQAQAFKAAPSQQPPLHYSTSVTYGWTNWMVSVFNEQWL